MAPKTSKSPESVVKHIKRKTRRKFNPEEKIRIILEGLKGEDSVAGGAGAVALSGAKKIIRQPNLILGRELWNPFKD